MAIVLGYSVFAKAEDPQVFVLVGYSSTYEIQKEDQKKVVASVLEKLRRIEDVLIDWEVQNQFYTTTSLSARNVIPHFVFTSDHEAHFTIRPMIWAGQKSHLPEALRSLNGKEVTGGKFKAEEIKDTSYGLEVIFGFYNKDTKDLEPLWTPEVSTNTASTLDLAFEGQKSSLKEMLTFYQKRPEYKLNVRHLVQMMCVYFALVDESWLNEKFIPEEQRLPQPSNLSKGKILMILGILQEAGELDQFLKR